MTEGIQEEGGCEGQANNTKHEKDVKKFNLNPSSLNE